MAMLLAKQKSANLTHTYNHQKSIKIFIREGYNLEAVFDSFGQDFGA
jgi:hypothetical protein